MKHLKKFNEKKDYTNSFLAGKEVLSDISDILISLKDEDIDYTMTPDINDDIKVKTIGLFFSGTSDVPRNFEIEIKTSKFVKDYSHIGRYGHLGINNGINSKQSLNDDQKTELESVIQRLVNYFDSINIELKFELFYSKNIPGARDKRNILRWTNVLTTENFDKSMLLIQKDIICNKIVINLKRK